MQTQVRGAAAAADDDDVDDRVGGCRLRTVWGCMGAGGGDVCVGGATVCIL